MLSFFLYENCSSVVLHHWAKSSLKEITIAREAQGKKHDTPAKNKIRGFKLFCNRQDILTNKLDSVITSYRYDIRDLHFKIPTHQVFENYHLSITEKFHNATTQIDMTDFNLKYDCMIHKTCMQHHSHSCLCRTCNISLTRVQNPTSTTSKQNIFTT